MRCFRFYLAFVMAALLGSIARAADPLNALLPQDTLAFIEIDPTQMPAGNSGGGASALVGVSLEAMQSFGLLPKEAGTIGDILGLASASGTQRSCIAWLDADFTLSRQNDLECNSVQLVWLVDTRGQPAEMVERITKLLAHLATRKTAHQTIRKTPELHNEFVEFHDDSWPAWTTLSWTQRGDIFILALGSGAMEHYLADRPVGGVPWAATLSATDTAAVKVGSIGSILARFYASPHTLRERFPQVMQRTTLGKFPAALGYPAADAGLISARIQGRVISLDYAIASPAGLAVTPWTIPLPVDSPLGKLIPAETTACLALNMDWPALYNRVLHVIDETTNRDEPVKTTIDEFASAQHVNIEKDILQKLQPLLLIHDVPQHPLRLPLMITGITAAAPGASDDVSHAMNALISAAAAVLDRKASKNAATPVPAATDLTHLRIRTDKDGITYLQMGLVGPAWTWVGNKLLFSWSPAAVRYNVAAVRAAPSQGFTVPATSR